MANVNAIIEFLDDYLIRSHRDYVEAVEANALLKKARLLSDSKDRPGKYLRDLMRRGLMPHAYQVGTRWKIPCSGLQKNNFRKTEYQVRSTRRESAHVKQSPNSVDIVSLMKQLEDARKKYKPHHVKILLVAEAPPDAIERFFYYENVPSHDWLFLGVAQALYPQLKEKYLATGRDAGLKKQILRKLRSDGFYLLDLSNLPLTLSGMHLSAQLPGLVEKVSEAVSEDTKIILIKANVYDLAYQYLKDAGLSVINKRIPFPGQGGQALFQAGFKHALSLSKFR